MYNPKVLAAIKDLPLLAKTVVDGFMNGYNKSTVKGPGLEFSQYRSYQPGDDLRWLDWRMFARSDRYYIRESEMETSIAVRFLVDASGSMAHEDEGISKIDYARFLTASLAQLAHMQGDAIGLYAFQRDGLFSLATRPDPQHLQRIFHELAQLRANGTFTQPAGYRQLFAGAARKELLVFVTDMYEAANEQMTILETLGAQRHEVIVFHLMAANELNFNYGQFSTLQDIETGETIPYGAAAKTAYNERLNAFLHGVKQRMLAKNIAYHLINTSQPLDAALRNFLVQRNNISH